MEVDRLVQVDEPKEADEIISDVIPNGRKVILPLRMEQVVLRGWLLGRAVGDRRHRG